jgi:hypothetical protein
MAEDLCSTMYFLPLSYRALINPKIGGLLRS